MIEQLMSEEEPIGACARVVEISAWMELVATACWRRPRQVEDSGWRRRSEED